MADGRAWLLAARRSLLDHLVVWVLGAVAMGMAFPALGGLEWLILPALFVMVGSISLTQDVRALAGAPWGTALALTVAAVALPAAAWAAGRATGMPEGLVLGLVVFFASPPELTTPVLSRIAGGDVALSLATLLVGAAAAVVIAPGAVALLGGVVAVRPLVQSLVAAVVAPMLFGTWIRTRMQDRLEPWDDRLAAVSAAMLVVVMLIVAAQSRPHLMQDPWLAALALAVGAPLLFLGGLVGRTMAAPAGPRQGRSAALSLGIRDFAVAAALIVAADLPRQGAVAALALGLAEIMGGAVAAGRWRRTGVSSAL